MKNEIPHICLVSLDERFLSIVNAKQPEVLQKIELLIKNEIPHIRLV